MTVIAVDVDVDVDVKVDFVKMRRFRGRRSEWKKVRCRLGRNKGRRRSLQRAVDCTVSILCHWKMSTADRDGFSRRERLNVQFANMIASNR